MADNTVYGVNGRGPIEYGDLCKRKLHILDEDNSYEIDDKLICRICMGYSAWDIPIGSESE